jgi:hypothetical protein
VCSVQRGQTALVLAARGPYPNHMKALLERGADPDLPDRDPVGL